MRNRSIAALIAVVLAGSLIAVALVRRGDAETDALRASPEASVPAEVVTRYQSTAAQRQGRVVRVDYTAGSGAATIGKHALVYLPAGYDTQDQQRRYDILYLMHGAGMNAESFLRGSGEPSTFKNLLDHMIEDDRMRPTIVVTPSFYPDGDASLDLHYAGQLDRVFPRELEDDLMPAVESRYRTFARTADAAGFTASRTHRAFGGFSMGAVTTWYVLIDSLDYFAFFMPMAGDCWVIEDSGGSGAPEQTAARLDQAVRESGYRRDEFLITASVGGNDGTRFQMEPQIREMRELTGSFDTSDDGNLRYTVDPDGGHDGESVNRQFYQSMPLFF